MARADALHSKVELGSAMDCRVKPGNDERKNERSKLHIKSGDDDVGVYAIPVTIAMSGNDERRNQRRKLHIVPGHDDGGVCAA